MSPPNITSTLGPTADNLGVRNIPDNATFVSDIQQNFLNYSFGGISLDLSSGNSLVAWEATPPGVTGPTMLNLATNILYNRALNASGLGSSSPSLIYATLQSFPAIDGGTLFALKWTAFFGVAMVRVSSLLIGDIVDEYSIGCISSILHSIRQQRTTFVRPSDATVKRTCRPYRSMARASTFRFHVLCTHCNSHDNYFRNHH